MRLRGWVPTVGGRLSFSVIGQFEHLKPGCYNHASHGVRTIICQQVRENTDIALPGGAVRRFYARYLQKSDLPLRYLLHAAAQGDGPLSGEVFIFSIDAWKAAESDIEQLRQMISKQAEGTREVVIILRSKADFSAKVELERNGFCTLEIDPALTEIKHQAEPGTHLPIADSRGLAAQCFYFIKDISHRHQNHSRHSDTLTTVYPIQDEVDVNWCVETVKTLYRSIIKKRRSRTRESRAFALGMLAYVDAFAGIAERRYGKKVKDIPLRNHGHIKAAIEAEAQAHDARDAFDQLWRGSNLVFRVILPLLGSLLALVAALRLVLWAPGGSIAEDIRSSRLGGYLQMAADGLLHYPEVITLFVLICVVLLRRYDKYMHGRAGSGGVLQRSFKYMQRQTLAIKQRHATTIYYLLAVTLFAALFYYLKALAFDWYTARL